MGCGDYGPHPLTADPPRGRHPGQKLHKGVLTLLASAATSPSPLPAKPGLFLIARRPASVGSGGMRGLLGS